MATFTPCAFEHQKREDGSFRISFRITHNRKSVYLKTDLFVVKQQLTRDFKIKDAFISKILIDQSSEYSRVLLNKFGADMSSLSVNEIKEFIEKKQFRGNCLDFISFSRQYLEDKKKKGKESTAKSIEKSLNAFLDFIKRDKIDFNKITRSLLEDFGDYLKSNRNIIRKNQFGKEAILKLKALDDYGVGKYFIDLRSLYYAGMDKYNDEDDSGELIIKHNPFKKLDIKIKRKTENINISIKQIRTIMNMPDHQFKRVNFARDIFILSYMLIGMNPVDLYCVDEYKNGRINYNRRKTAGRREDNAFMSLKIEPEMLPYINHYLDRTGKRVFNFHLTYSDSLIFNANLNKGLKIVQKVCGIKENLTMYVARRSWATIARNDRRISIDDIAQGLNHVDERHKTTFIYIEKDITPIDEANRKMLDLLFSHDEK